MNSLVYQRQANTDRCTKDTGMDPCSRLIRNHDAILKINISSPVRHGFRGTATTGTSLRQVVLGLGE